MAHLDIGSALSRVMAGTREVFEYACSREVSDLAQLGVESEIELMFVAAFQVVCDLNRNRIFIGREFAHSPENPENFVIQPQFEWGGYRIDFCIRYLNPRAEQPDYSTMVFVECDGHDFHERTKEQAERDRTKDRAIQAAGITILRFTGREIWRNPAEVALETIGLLLKKAGSSDE